MIRQGGENTTVVISGTQGSDTFEFTAGATQQTIKVNDRVYTVPSSEVATYKLDGLGGNDTVKIVGTAANETAIFRPASTVFQMPDYTLKGTPYTVTTLNIEQVQVDGGGGYDKAYLYDSLGNDRVEVQSNEATLKLWGSDDLLERVVDFDWVSPISNAGGIDSKLLTSPIDFVFETEGTWLNV